LPASQRDVNNYHFQAENTTQPGEAKRFFLRKKTGGREKREELRHDNIDFYLVSLGLAQYKIRFTHPQLDGAAKRGLVNHIKPGTWSNAKIKKSLAHGTAGIVPFDADAASGCNIAEQSTFFPTLIRAALPTVQGAFLFGPPELHRKNLSCLSCLFCHSQDYFINFCLSLCQAKRPATGQA